NEKMSKSRGNVVNPDLLVSKYGADTVRAYLMFIGPWDQGGPWNDKGIEGVSRFFNRIWALVVDGDAKNAALESAGEADARELKRAVSHAIKEVTEDLEAFRFNTAIAELMTLLNSLYKARAKRTALADTWTSAVDDFLLLLAPIAPHIAEELWQRSGHTESVHLQPWPEFDPAALVANTVTMAVQVNGKVRGQIEVPSDADEATLLALAKSEENVARHLAGATIKREI